MDMDKQKGHCQQENDVCHVPPERRNKIWEWMHSGRGPLLDLSDMSPKEYRAFMREVMK